MLLLFTISATGDSNDIKTEEIAELEQPWGIDFVDNQTALVTEKAGHISIVDLKENSSYRLGDVPDIEESGQGGLLDIEYEEGTVYLTYTNSQEDEQASRTGLINRIIAFILGSTPSESDDGLATYLGKAEVDFEEQRLVDFEVLHVAEPYMDTDSHFGSRVITQEDYVYFTVGDKGDKEFESHVSQNTDNELGTTLRLYKNGTIPNDNPFYGEEGYKDSIYTYGHRNAQGMTINPGTGDIWQSEHGEQDGDEINILESGGNYGWPETHYGCTYVGGESIGEQPHEREDIVDPVYYWECNTGGFPPAGMTFYTGDNYDGFLEGDLFIGNLAGQYLGQFSVNGTAVEEESPLLEEEGWRVRDVEQSPNGYLYVLVDGNDGSLVRLEE